MSSASNGARYIPPEDIHTTEAPPGRLQQGKQAFGHQVRPEHVRGQLDFVTLRRFGPLGRHRAGVVHQSVQRGHAVGKIVGPRAHGVEV